MLQFSTYYHIYNHANGDDNLFREEKNYSYFLEKYRQHINPIARTAAWCLMPNHFHLLVKINNEAEVAPTFPKFGTLEKLGDRSNFISKQFANFFSSYTQSFNKVYKRRGSLFLKNFKRKEITDDHYLQHLIIYIHLNPVKHGFTTHTGDWPWTSYEEFIHKEDQLLKLLFGDKENYQSMHELKICSFNEYSVIEKDLT